MTSVAVGSGVNVGSGVLVAVGCGVKVAVGGIGVSVGGLVASIVGAAWSCPTARVSVAVGACQTGVATVPQPAMTKTIIKQKALEYRLPTNGISSNSRIDTVPI